MGNKGDIYVKAVETRREMNDFVALPRRIYAGNPYYVPDLDIDVRATFKSEDNVSLEFSEIQPFVAYDGGEIVGRIVAIVNRRANEKWGTRVVRFGMIEFVDSVDVAAALLAAVERWGKERGMDEVEGPMGIFDFDKEGMLVDGFDQMSSMVTIYNPPYYPRHLETCGYTKKVDWIQIKVDVPKEIPERFVRVAHLCRERFHLTTHKLTNGDIKQGYGKRVFQLLNEAYSSLFGYSELSDSQIDQFVKRYMSLIDFRMVSLVENGKGELVGVAITMGSLSQAFRRTNGKLLPLGWYHLVKALKFKHEDKVELLLIAVRPDYQGLGVNALFFSELIPVYNRLGYKWAETGPQLEDNFRELSQWKALNPVVSKRRRCYGKTISTVISS